MLASDHTLDVALDGVVLHEGEALGKVLVVGSSAEVIALAELGATRSAEDVAQLGTL